MSLEIVVVYFGGLEFGMDQKEDSSDYCHKTQQRTAKDAICPRKNKDLSSQASGAAGWAVSECP